MSNSNDSSETVSVDPDVEMLDLEPQSVAAAADKENQTSLPVNRQTLATTTTVHQSTAATTAANTTSGGGYRSPWVELYRPRTLSDVLGNEETILRLRAIAKDGNLPNLILCGPPGTGTCSVLNAAISRECNRNARHWILTLSPWSVFGTIHSTQAKLPVSMRWLGNCSVQPTRMPFWN